MIVGSLPLSLINISPNAQYTKHNTICIIIVGLTLLYVRVVDVARPLCGCEIREAMLRRLHNCVIRRRPHQRCIIHAVSNFSLVLRPRVMHARVKS